jgi:hypothetical protein
MQQLLLLLLPDLTGMALIPTEACQGMFHMQSKPQPLSSPQKATKSTYVPLRHPQHTNVSPLHPFAPSQCVVYTLDKP